MTRKEKDYLRDVAQLSCIACRINNQTTTPVEVHHQRSGIGLGRKASHFDTMPLCPLHHRFSNYDSVHLAPETFRKLYGRESDLVKQTQTDVENYRKTFVGYVGEG